MSNNRNSATTMALAAGLICLLVYLRTLSCGFVNMDDPDYVLNNPLVRALDWNHMVAAFSTVHAGFWMPLTWISLALDYHMWGLNPVGYHLTNILLHSLNTGLVVLVAAELGKVIARPGKGRQVHPLTLLLAGLLWGLHPLRVESVAWVTERKDVLNGLFFLGSLLSYLRYAQESRSPENHFRVRSVYILSLALFVLSLLAKPISVILPLMLLALDRYPLRRLSRASLRAVVAEKIPFLACAGAMVAATLSIARHANILASYDNLSLLQRLAVSGNALFEYCRFMLWPAGVLPLHVIDASQMAVYALKGTAFVLFSAAGVYAFRNGRWPATVLLCFLLPLLPVLAIFQNGIQAFASRFTYLPSIAPGIMAAYAAEAVYMKSAGRWPGFPRRAVCAAGVAVIVAYGFASWRFIGIWKNTETLWSRIIDLQPTGRAFKERGLYYLSTGSAAAAAGDLSASIRFAQRAGLDESYKLYAFRGVALLNQGHYRDAVEDFSRAIALCPDPRYFYQRGRALTAVGKVQEAASDFNRAGSADGPIEWGNSACR
ncbi:MAG: tetratricopeptide repeat protein [Geobacteraceae bacterium]|nr:tetratricopeptide repeat protein [Geobacteraceae bacterium]